MQAVDSLEELPAAFRELPEHVLLHLTNNQGLLGTLFHSDGTVNVAALERLKLELDNPGKISTAFSSIANHLT